MTHYTLEELIAMNDEALGKAARKVFSMHFDPFSELGKRAMKRRLDDMNWVRKSGRISPALTVIIGTPTLVMENILDYQEALSNRGLRSSN